METFAEQLKRRRRRLGMSQSQIAGALGVDVMTVSRWERGVMGPALPVAALALLHALKPLPKSERRFGIRRPKKDQKGSR